MLEYNTPKYIRAYEHTRVDFGVGIAHTGIKEVDQAQKNIPCGIYPFVSPSRRVIWLAAASRITFQEQSDGERRGTRYRYIHLADSNYRYTYARTFTAISTQDKSEISF